jgi:hypothetical protein
VFNFLQQCVQEHPRHDRIEKAKDPFQGGTPWHAQLLIPIINAFRAKTSREQRSIEPMAGTSVRSITSLSTSCPDAWPTPNVTEEQLKDAPEFSDDSWHDREWDGAPEYWESRAGS